MAGAENFEPENAALDDGRLFSAHESDLRKLIENAPIGIAFVRNRRVVRVNEAVCRLFGYSREELIGASTRLVYFTDEEYERLGRQIAELRKNPTPLGPPLGFIGRHKKGHPIEAIIQIAFLESTSPNADAAFFVTDMSDHVRTERELREKDRRLGTLMSNLPGMAYRCANDEKWTMELVSEGCLGLTGYTAAELIGKNAVSFADLIVGDDRELVWNTVQAALAKRETFRIVYRIRRKDQQVRWVSEQGSGVFNFSGQLEALEGLIFDVTQQKESELSLSASEEKYRNIFTQSVAGIFQLDRSGRYRAANPALAAMHGYASPEEMIKDVHDVANKIYARPEDRVRVLEKLQKEGQVRNLELEVKRKNGERFWILTNATGVKGEDGEIAYIEGTNIEISDQKRAEALRKAKAEAEAASRAKTAFLAHMSHELRTPMNAMLGFCQLLLRDSSLTPRQREYLLTIDRNGQHLLHIIGDILETAKIEANRLTFAFNRISVADLQRDLESTFRARAELKKLEFFFSVEKDAPKEVWGDRVKVRQILINLIGNAFKFTQQGSVTVRVRGATDAENPEQVYFEVADTGLGIAADDLERLFEPFEQTAAGAILGGTGLGLPISREYARKMQGDLTVRSTLGEGSVFRLSLPVPPPDEKALPPQESPPAAAASAPLSFKSGARVLIADDIEDNRRLLRGMLVDLGCSIREVDNGLDAVIAKAEWQPHCILMDARMPGLDGVEATRRIRKMDMTGVKILILSAAVDEFHREEAIVAGANDFLPKPFRPEELLGKLRVWLAPEKNGETSAPASAPALGADWTAAIKRALTEADLEKISALLETLGQTDPAHAAEFSKMAERFDFDAIRRGLDAL